MFTGIIEAVGHIKSLTPKQGDTRAHIETGELPLADVQLGDSIAVNGVCLTVVQLPGDGFCADVSRETIDHSSFAHLQAGMPVNLEKALLPTTRLGGHLVSGHVDGIGEVLERREDGRSVRFQFRAPDQLARYIAQKGSICIDGISLTVNGVAGARFDVNIVPHTLKQTIMHRYQVGTRVNLEVDQVARYLERLLLGDQAADPGKSNKTAGVSHTDTDIKGNKMTGIDMELLREKGFA